MGNVFLWDRLRIEDEEGMYGEFCRAPSKEEEEQGVQEVVAEAKTSSSPFSSSSPSRTPAASASASAPAAALAAARAAVASAVSSVLGPGVGEHTPLADAGLDSLGAVDLRNALARSLTLSQARGGSSPGGSLSSSSSSVELPVTLAYDHPTPAALAAFVAGRLVQLMSTASSPGRKEEEGEVEAEEGMAATARAVAAVPPSLPILASSSSFSSSSSSSSFSSSSSHGVVEIAAASASFAGADSCGATSGDSLSALWRSASSPSFDGASAAPAERWGCGDAVDSLYSPVATPGKTYVRHACWLPGVARVDAQALRLSPPEAAALDPQARALVEHCAAVVVDVAPSRSPSPSPSPSSSSSSSSSRSLPPSSSTPPASFSPSSLSTARPVGLFVGVMHMEFLQATAAMTGGAPATPAGASGNGMDFLAGRASYCLGLSGAAATVHTACSSSLVAVHLARRALLLDVEEEENERGGGGGGGGLDDGGGGGEEEEEEEEEGEGEASPPPSSSSAEGCSAGAVAAGVHLMLLPATFAGICQLQALSPSGRCRPLDSDADGYGRGDGVAALLLRRQRKSSKGKASSSPSSSSSSSSAPPPLGFILGSSVRQAGTPSGLTAPSGPAQTAAVSSALREASVSFSELLPQSSSSSSSSSSSIPVLCLSLVAMHGTGTPLGDPIEIGALASALSERRRRRGERQKSSPPSPLPLALAAPKGSFGHAKGAAGLAGLLSALASADQRAAPPIGHLRKVNPYAAGALEDWRRCEGRGGGGGEAASSAALAPRSLAPLPQQKQLPSSSSHPPPCIAGASSFGMSTRTSCCHLRLRLPRRRKENEPPLPFDCRSAAPPLGPHLGRR